MHVELRYFSGTGNSHKILSTCNDVFMQNNRETSFHSITEAKELNQSADIVGFCFPVYAFGLPRICRKYLSKLPSFNKPTNAFLLITAGASDETGFSVNEGRSFLKKVWSFPLTPPCQPQRGRPFWKTSSTVVPSATTRPMQHRSKSCCAPRERTWGAEN